MSISLKFAALALAAFAALPAVGRANPLQQVQPPMLVQVARSTTPSQITPNLFDPSDPATASLMRGLPLTTTFALTAPQRSIFTGRYLALVGNASAKTRTQAPIQAPVARVASKSNDAVTQQGAWLASYHPDSQPVRAW